MIITKLQGGLGNQMFQYAIAKSLAEKKNNIFKLDLSFFPKQSLRNYELNQFNITENIATQYESMLLAGSESIFNKALRHVGLTNRPKTYFPEKKKTRFDQSVLNYKKAIYLDGYWQNEEYFIDIRYKLCADFTPKKSLSPKAKNLLQKIQEGNSVSLHVRRGDYVTNQTTNSAHGTCSLEYYQAAVKYIQLHVKSPCFFIFSDDISWCKKELDFIDSKFFVDGADSAIEDLELMKNCQHNIIANSSFSWWGAWLNQTKGKIVISPKTWFASESELTISCDEWLKI